MAIPDLVNLLSDVYVTYELLVRQESISLHTLISKKRRLIEILELESRNPDEATHIRSTLSVRDDLIECRTLFTELRAFFDADKISYAHVIDARIKFLSPRVDRIAPPEDSEFVEIKNTLSDDIVSLKVQIGMISIPVPVASTPNVSPNNSNPFNSERSSNSNSHPFANPPTPIREQPDYRSSLHNNAHLWKWDIRFSGDETHSCASEFLQNVSDYAKSRNVSEVELLNGISDLFTGSARKWFRTERRAKPFTDWHNFVTRFLKDFEPASEQDKLLEFIKSRVQQPGESIVKYFIEMQDLFMRLPCIPTEFDRVKIIRKNLLPSYVNALALYDYYLVEDLKEACRRLETVGEGLEIRRSLPSTKPFVNQPRSDPPNYLQRNYPRSGYYGDERTNFRNRDSFQGNRGNFQNHNNFPNRRIFPNSFQNTNRDFANHNRNYNLNSNVTTGIVIIICGLKGKIQHFLRR